jgi:quercetin dioxygenase-like cupin family protein
MEKQLLAAVLIAFSSSAMSQDKVIQVTPDALTWRDSPTLPKGAQVAVLLGDATKAGEVIIRRIKFPANFQVPPHTHPYAENITVISGSVGFGMGEKFEKKGALAKAGAFYAQPAKYAHYLWTGNEEAIIQVQFIGIGGSGIVYINPADDPRKR